MPLAVLTMTKDIGFAYALIVTFLIGLDQLFGTPHPDTKPARIFGVSLAKCSILAAVVLAVFISWNRYTAAVTPTETAGASVGSAGLSYGAVLTGGIKQLLGFGREERFAQIMQSMGQAFSVPPRLFGGRAHHGRQLHSAAVHGGLCGSACRCRTPPHRGWLCGRGVLLCRAVSLPPDFVLLQFLRGRRLRLEGL